MGVILWRGKLEETMIEFGFDQTFMVDGRRAFTAWQPGDLLLALRRHCGKIVQIVIEEIEPREHVTSGE